MSPGRGAALAVASGALLAASLPGPGPGWLAFVAHAPLLLALDRASARRAALCGALALGTAALLSVRFAWTPLRSTLSPALTLLALLALASGQALAGAVLGGLTALASRRVALPVAFVAAHLLIEQAPSTLPWSLALAVHDRLPLLQAAALGGAPLVASLVASASVTAAWPLARWRGRRWPGRWALAPVGALALAVLLGSRRLDRLDRLEVSGVEASGSEASGVEASGSEASGVEASGVEAPGREAAGSEAAGDMITVGVVHGDVALTGRPPVEGLAALRRAHDECERRGATIVVWPETSLPFALRPGAIEADLRAQLEPLPRAATALGVLVEGPDGVTNSALLIEQGRVVGRHDKRVLLPFGEYIPLGSWWPWLQALAPAPRAPTPAGAPPPTVLAGRPVACQICYEGVVAGASGDEVARQGAVLVLNLANDAWFDGTDEPALHLAAIRLRAVELGRPWLRAANRGVSAVVAPSGRLLATAEGSPGRAVLARVRVGSGPTAFTRLGLAGAWLGLLPLLFALRAWTTTPL